MAWQQRVGKEVGTASRFFERNYLKRDYYQQIQDPYNYYIDYERAGSDPNQMRDKEILRKSKHEFAVQQSPSEVYSSQPYLKHFSEEMGGWQPGQGAHKFAYVGKRQLMSQGSSRSGRGRSAGAYAQRRQGKSKRFNEELPENKYQVKPAGSRKG